MRQKFDKNRIARLCEQKDKDTVPSMKAQVALNELAAYLLGPDWYDASGLTHPENVNVSIVCAIEKKYLGTRIKKESIPDYMKRSGYCMLSELLVGELFIWKNIKFMRVSGHPVIFPKQATANVLRLDNQHTCAIRTDVWVTKVPNE